MKHKALKKLNALKVWCKKWKLSTSPEKSNLINFSRERSTIPPLLKICDKPIPEGKSLKIPGIIFDPNITWKNHINYLRQKGFKFLNAINALSSPKIGTRSDHLLNIINATIRFIFDYGSQLFSFSSNSNRQKLEPIYNTALRLALGLPRNTPLDLLKELNIEFSDSFSEDLEIDLLMGSNVLGRILIKKCWELDSGLSVVETKLENTVIGMQNNVCHIDRNVMTTLLMYVRNIKLTDLCSLENLGICNPTLEESKQNSYEDALNDFQQKLTILHNGRYELQLPWKHDPVNLPENKGLTWARHENVIKRAESNGFLREYQKVFEDWENLGIIEIVPEEEVKAVKCHYLAHRPVIKLQNETTKYRPCFVKRHTGEASVLGMLWNLDKDTLRCNINFEILTCETKITKRLILSTVQKVFDANGLLSPTTLPPKLLLQETWKLELPWDSELPKNIVNKFMKWANEMYLLKEVSVPRYIAINETSELHIFVDASKSSYGACAFVRTVVENDVKVTLLRSKARVAPLKSLTIPRLELMSCCIGARLANSIATCFKSTRNKGCYFGKKEVVMKRVPCRRYSSNSPMSESVNLPADRVKDANAFDITGIDLAGPLFTRDGGKAILTYEELLTVLCDCEAVVNSRPLTYVSEDPNDLIPLTPSLFLNGESSYDTIDLDLSEFSKFQKRIRYRRKLIHDFRSRFRKEYLGQLRQKRPGKPGHDFKVGDVVIEEPSKKRVYWPLGKVISLLPGRDGKVRTLKLKCKNSELIRPIQRVYPLEVPFINNEIVKIDGVPTSSVNEDKLTSNAVIKNKVTRSGRLVKIPERLGLFNEVLYAFE
ncbi:integrase catalytic domain-containing protein [Trichonephila clavipes]|nr:integrase catalytic domain-containing protein [Trichonephila clavipes]